MPKYTYKCNNCDNIVEQWHSIKEKLKDCEQCLKEGIGSTLKRLPNAAVISSSKNHERSKKTGDITKKFIEDAKKDLKQDKKNLEQQRTYKK